MKIKNFFIIANDDGWYIAHRAFGWTRVQIDDLVGLPEGSLTISIAAPVITKEIVESCKTTLINIHTAPLPHYRGRATDSWRIGVGFER